MYKLAPIDFFKLKLLFAIILLLQSNNNHAAATNNIKEYLPDAFWNLNLTRDAFQHTLQRKCENEIGVGSTASVEVIESSAIKLLEYLSSDFNLTKLNADIEMANLHDDLDAVVRQQCTKVQTLEQYARDLQANVQYCVTFKEYFESVKLLNAITALLNFFCFRGGIEIQHFIIDGGAACMESNKAAIRNCVFTTYEADILNLPKMTNTELVELLLQPKDCENIERLDDCMTKYLSNCIKPTTATIVEAAFKDLKKAIDCPVVHKEKPPKLIMNDSVKNHLDIGLMTLLTIVATILHFH